jgi:acetylglutamate kinase
MKDVSILRTALPYIQRFRENIFVIKLGGNVIIDFKNLDLVAEEITLLHLVGIHIVVVHGGGKQADELLEKLHLTSRKINGRRVTDDDTLEVAKMVYSGKISTEIVSALRRHGAKGVGLTGIDGGLIQARRRPPVKVFNKETGQEEMVDYGHVGDIEKVNPDLLLTLVNARYIPVVASLGADEKGNVLNINADVIAGEIAKSLKADKLISMSNVRGVLRDLNDPDSCISSLSIREAQELIQKGIITSGMLPKIQSCIAAVEGGVRRAHIIDGTKRDSLLKEIFRPEGEGTMIVTDSDKEKYLTEEFKG